MGRVQVTHDLGRGQTYSMNRVPPGDVHIYVELGETFPAGSRFVMGSVPKPSNVRCDGPCWDYQADLLVSDQISRYAAIKAAALKQDTAMVRRLEAIVDDSSEDGRLVLEAIGSLARIVQGEWTEEIAHIARGRREETVTLAAAAMGMGAIFILSELKVQPAAAALSELAADDLMDSEARAAAVGGLGQGGADQPNRVLPFLADADDFVALHALAGIGRVPVDLLPRIQALLRGSEREAAAAAALLARQDEPGADALLDATTWGDTGRDWALFALGQMPCALVERVGRDRLTADMRQTLIPLWIGAHGNWLQREDNARDFQLLNKQRVREDPSQPVST